MGTAGRPTKTHDRTRTVSYERIERIADWCAKLGFERDQGFANFRMGWWRAYNTRHAKNGKTYGEGATGIQMEWRHHDDGTTKLTVRTWRNGPFKPL